MKKTLLTMLVMVAAFCSAMAQDQKVAAAVPAANETDQKEMMAKQAREWQELLVTELKLTEEQVKKMDEMNRAFGERRQSIHNNTTLSDEEKNERKMKLKNAYDEQLAKLLTEQQLARFKELVAERSKKG